MFNSDLNSIYNEVRLNLSTECGSTYPVKCVRTVWENSFIPLLVKCTK